MKVDWTVIASLIAALSSLVSVIATIFIVRLTARYARSAELQADAAISQSSVAARSMEALELQMREIQASRNAATVTAAVGVMVIVKVWFRLMDCSPVPREPKLIFPALVEAAQVSVQFSPTDAHRMRRIFEMLSTAEGELDVLRQLSGDQESLALDTRESIRNHLRAAHHEAIRVLQSLAPEHAYGNRGGLKTDPEVRDNHYRDPELGPLEANLPFTDGIAERKSRLRFQRRGRQCHVSA